MWKSLTNIHFYCIFLFMFHHLWLVVPIGTWPSIRHHVFYLQCHFPWNVFFLIHMFLWPPYHTYTKKYSLRMSMWWTWAMHFNGEFYVLSFWSFGLISHKPGHKISVDVLWFWFSHLISHKFSYKIFVKIAILNCWNILF